MSLPSTTTRFRRRLAAPVIAATAVISLATSPAFAQVATLGPLPEEEASAAPIEELNEQDAMLAWAGCLRDNGIEVTDPVFDAAGVMVGGLEFEGGKDAGPKDAKGGEFLAASEACNEFLVGADSKTDPALREEQTEAALRFAVCMREQGLDFPDPAPEGTTFEGADVKIDKESAEFQAAFEVCGDSLDLDGAGK